MEGRHNISQYLARLDKTLASHDLANEETLKTLVRNQMLQPSQCEAQECIDNVVEKRTKEVSHFLGMLRSASVSDNEGAKANEAPHRGWKVKQDSQDYRVMYREGPEGTPFHTLLVEGYVDGPIDDCLCISWEAGLYQKWWPQFSIPTFKVVSSECLQKVRIGEQISLIRMKLSWPLSTREALVHYFEFEYFQDDLIVVLLNSISDLESIDKSTHGFTRDGIPDVQDVIRIDVVGGMALQKVTADRSYFRTIMNMDLKLDFVPPAFINFISRQLIGSGFRLYKKEVAFLSKGDEDFRKALKEPLYTRIRQALYSNNISEGDLETKNLKADTSIPSEEHPEITIQAEGINMVKEVLIDRDHANHYTPEAAVVIDRKAVSEIEEIKESERLEEDGNELYEHPANEIIDKCNNREKIIISSEVEKALGTLDKVISIFREYGFNPQTWSLAGFTEKTVTNSEKDPKLLEYQICSNSGSCVEVPMNELMERSPHETRNSFGSHGSRHAGYISYAVESKDNKIAWASPAEGSGSSCETRQSSFSFSINEAAKAAVSEKSTNEVLVNGGDANGIDENTFIKRKNKKLRFCCFHSASGRLKT